MASSFLFSIEGTAEASKNRPLATIGQHRPLKFVSFTNLRCWNDNLRKSINAAAAVRDSVGGGREKPSEEAFQESIQKSQQLLDVQSELFQQIAERRKLVDSEKTGTNNAVEGRGSSRDSLNSSPPNSINSDENGGSCDVPVSDQVHDKSSGGSARGSPIKRLGVELDFSKSAQISSSDLSFLDSGSVVKAEETSTLHTTLPMSSRAITPENVLEESMANILLHNTDEPTPEDIKPPPLAGPNVMNVIMVAAECSPFSKTGGLGDVAGSLPKALARRGHRVMVVIPKYGDYPEAQHTGVVKRYKVAGQDHEVSYLHAFIGGVDFVFIENHMFHAVENNIYGGNRLDVLRRMILFCKATVEVPWHVPCGGVCYGDGNLVFVANDWHTALLPVYLKAYYRDKGLMVFTRSVLVIHNIAHQGRGPIEDFSLMELPSHWLDQMRLYDPVGGEHLNVFAGGLKAADRIVTVSHGYVWELKSVEGGWGLHEIIRENDWKLRGIVNGIDTKEWSPEHDVHLRSDGYTNYSVETLDTGKAQCKRALQNELGLPQKAEVPLIGFIGRLDSQKGVDLIAEAIPWMMEQDVQVVMLGTGRPDLEDMLRHFEGQYRDRARGWVGFSVRTAHRITAGADILLMPSRFEPCGLNQLYAMNYGTVPVVHAVGGLRDTVQPFDPYQESGLGWTFDRAESGKLIEALGNCLYTYREYKRSWKGLQRRGMTQDLSWDHAAQTYEQVLVAAKYHW